MKTKRITVCSLLLAPVVLMSWQSPASAQYTDYNWNVLGGGTVNWQTSSWTQTGEAHASPYPNSSFHAANLSVPLTGSLTVNVNGGPVTVGPISLGGTSGAVTTNIAGTNGGFLLLKNDDDADFNDNRQVDGLDFLRWQIGFQNFGGQAPSAEVTNGDGDADADMDVDHDDLARWEELYGSTTMFGSSRIVSGGVPGSTNLISAPIHLSTETLAMAEESTNDLTLSGEIRPTGGVPLGSDTPEERGQVSRIRNYSDKTLFITGVVNTVDPADGTFRRLFINDGNTSRGKIHFTNTSSIIGDGISVTGGGFNSGQQIVIGSLQAIAPLTTVQIDSANPGIKGKVVFNGGNLILGNDMALGDPNEASFVFAGQTGRIGFNILSTEDTRNIPINLDLAQPVTFKGEHSLQWSGRIEQSNSRRGIINLLPAGKTLTLSGRFGANNGDPSVFREVILDGTGETLVTGGLHDDDINHNGIIGDGDDPNEDANDTGPTTQGTYIKRGSGVVRVSGTTSTFRGHLEVDMGNLHFDRYDHLAAMAGDPNSELRSRGGAIGLATGSYSNTSFRGLFSNTGDTVDTGGVMLAPSEAGAALNFGTTHASMRMTTIAAPENGITFTGTITVPVANPTVRLGGGSGTLTMAASKVDGTGAGAAAADRNLYVANGGKVKLTGSGGFASDPNTTVEITAKYHLTRQDAAAADSFADLDNVVGREGPPANQLVYVGTTLEVDTLANGGANSGIGAGAASADRVLIRGSTLRYVGPAASTNRLFTVGTGGAMIDASGAGAVDFSNTGALGMEAAEDRLGSNDSFEARSNVVTGLSSTDDLVVGMTVTGFTGGCLLGTCTIPDDTTIVDILSPTSIQLSDAPPLQSFTSGGTISFGDFSRTLTLTGTNGGNNFMRPLIADAAQGPVGVTKTGSGKWILTNASNAYTGPTTVEDGILSLTSAFLGNTSDVSLTTGGTLDLNFVGTDMIGSLFFDGVQQAAGTWGSLASSATNKSSFFTGNGLLNVGIGALQAVPEPGTLALLTCGLLLAGRRRRG